MANPKTCLHNVVESSKDTRVGPGARCCSCDTEITDELWLRKNYVYDIDYAVWVHKPKDKPFINYNLGHIRESVKSTTEQIKGEQYCIEIYGQRIKYFHNGELIGVGSLTQKSPIEGLFDYDDGRMERSQTPGSPGD